MSVFTVMSVVASCFSRHVFGERRNPFSVRCIYTRVDITRPPPTFSFLYLALEFFYYSCNQNIWQKTCQTRMSEDMSERMPERMPETMAEKDVRRYVVRYVRKNVRIGCQKRCQKRMSEDMSEEMSQRTSLLNGVY